MLLGILALLSLCGPTLACPDEQDKPQEEVEKLKKEVKELREKLERTSDRISELESRPSLLQRFQLQLFGNITGRFDDRPAVRNATALGGLDLFIQADLGKGLTILNEDVLVNTPTNTQAATIQRIYAKYKYDDWLSVKVGREHTPFGYWNSEYHHGFYFQTPVDRPLMWTFESASGVLPTHLVGVELSGHGERLGGLSYTLFAGNGRGRTSTEVENVVDSNEEKSFGGRVEYTGLSDLRVGVSGYFDTVTAAPNNDEFREYILGVHGVYTLSNLTLVAEGFSMVHQGLDLGTPRKFQGGYVMISYDIGSLSLTPYLLAERMNFDTTDPFFGSQPDVNQLRFGVRWDFHPNAAIKLEYDHSFLRKADDVNAFLIDVSFGI